MNPHPCPLLSYCSWLRLHFLNNHARNPLPMPLPRAPIDHAWNPHPHPCPCPVPLPRAPCPCPVPPPCSPHYSLVYCDTPKCLELLRAGEVQVRACVI